jgi:hypothetical protein
MVDVAAAVTVIVAVVSALNFNTRHDQHSVVLKTNTEGSIYCGQSISIFIVLLSLVQLVLMSLFIPYI